jgi:hypothetical protein
MDKYICRVCGKDHHKPNKGELTVCELEGYSIHGSVSAYRIGNKKYRCFGAGVRYQHG